MPRRHAKPAPDASESKRKSAATGKDPKKVEAGRKGGKASAELRGGERTPGSGRKPGTPNRRTVEVMEVLRANKYNPDLPFLFWAELLTEGMRGAGGKLYVLGYGDKGSMMQGVVPVPLMLEAAKQLASYVAPRRKMVDVGEGDDAFPDIVFEEDFTQLGTPRPAPAALPGPAPGPTDGTAPAPEPARHRRRIVVRTRSGFLDALGG